MVQAASHKIEALTMLVQAQEKTGNLVEPAYSVLLDGYECLQNTIAE